MSKILTIFRMPDMTVAKYDNIMKDLEKAGLKSVKARPFHCMAKDGNSAVVTDVWDSNAALDKFFETLGPILIKNGVVPQPPEVFPVHNIVQ